MLCVVTEVAVEFRAQSPRRVSDPVEHSCQGTQLVLHRRHHMPASRSFMPVMWLSRLPTWIPTELEISRGEVASCPHVQTGSAAALLDRLRGLPTAPRRARRWALVAGRLARHLRRPIVSQPWWQALSLQRDRTHTRSGHRSLTGLNDSGPVVGHTVTVSVRPPSGPSHGRSAACRR